MLIREGYGNKTLEEFLEAVVAHQPDLVVDARLKPFSKRREYMKGSLERAFRAKGIRYEHWPGLGNLLYQTPDRVQIANPDSVRYLHELAEDKTVVVMCACATGSRRCHVNVVVGTGAKSGCGAGYRGH